MGKRKTLSKSSTRIVTFMLFLIFQAVRPVYLGLAGSGLEQATQQLTNFTSFGNQTAGNHSSSRVGGSSANSNNKAKAT